MDAAAAEPSLMLARHSKNAEAVVAAAAVLPDQTEVVKTPSAAGMDARQIKMYALFYAHKAAFFSSNTSISSMDRKRCI